MLKTSRYRCLSVSTARKVPRLEVTRVPGGNGAAVVWVAPMVTVSSRTTVRVSRVVTVRETTWVVVATVVVVTLSRTVSVLMRVDNIELVTV